LRSFRDRLLPASWSKSSLGAQSTYVFTKDHGLHQVEGICLGCSSIDLLRMRAGRHQVLQESCWQLLESAKRCKLCAMIAQTLMARYNANVETAMTLHGFSDRRDSPLCIRQVVADLEVYIDTTLSGERKDIHVAYFRFRPCSGAEILTSSPGMETKTGTPAPSIDERANVAVLALDPQIGSLSKCSCITTCRLPKLPTRIIDLQTHDPTRIPSILRLHVPKKEDEEEGHYAALSHRWGKTVPFQTRRSTLLTRQSGFSMDELPQSFQDAVVITHALGIRYLWIDCLCIIQDDQEDWLQQSGLMGHIFSNSTVTIAGHVAEDSTQGLLKSFTVPETLRIDLRDKSAKQFEILIPNLSPRLTFRDSFIVNRAWAFQELCLSARILHIGRDSMHWECTHERIYLDQQSDIIACDTPTLAQMLRDSRAKFPRTPTVIYDSWLALIERYSKCRMTLSTDKLVAIAGLSATYENLFPLSFSHGYHCGVYEADLERSLLWHANLKGALLKYPSRAPSWSWASVDGSLSFVMLDKAPDTIFKKARIISIAHPDELGASTYPGDSQRFFHRSGLSCSIVVEGLAVARNFHVWPRAAKQTPFAPTENRQEVGAWSRY
ncbi:heterokaryon incompatibility protein-domain-containing protein, partial [Nemania abortiva]